jgi:endonuclease V-like protein UPF0215 family
MRTLEERLQSNKSIRVAGFDDASFLKEQTEPVKLTGVICSDTRFEGMLWGEVSKDGLDATSIVSQMLRGSKFYPQINVVLLDGIAFGGFNIIDLPELASQLNRPCISVMRRYPDLQAIDNALRHFSDYQERKSLIVKAGKIYHHHNFYFQPAGCMPDTAARALQRVTDRGNVPEALRLAHLIGAAVMNGESSSRA